MIILKEGMDSKENIGIIAKEIEYFKLGWYTVRGERHTTISIIGEESDKPPLFEIVSNYDFVEKATPVQPNRGYKLVARANHPEFKDNLRTVRFKIGNAEIGNSKRLIIAGPCAVHTEEQTLEIAEKVKDAGAHVLRGGAYKPRTSPYSFQGLGERGLEILAKAKEKTGLPIVTEVIDPRMVGLVGSYADMLQIGARSMQNYPLLKEVGRYAAKHDKAVLLKTSPMPSLDEVLCGAEYMACEGAEKIVLCERGMGFTISETRNTPNFTFLKKLRELTYLPVIGDPSHSTGDRELVINAADSYLSFNANGLIVEVIRDKEEPKINSTAVCDYAQGIRARDFKKYMDSLRERNII